MSYYGGITVTSVPAATAMTVIPLSWFACYAKYTTQKRCGRQTDDRNANTEQMPRPQTSPDKCLCKKVDAVLIFIKTSTRNIH